MREKLNNKKFVAIILGILLVFRIVMFVIAYEQSRMLTGTINGVYEISHMANTSFFGIQAAFYALLGLLIFGKRVSVYTFCVLSLIINSFMIYGIIQTWGRMNHGINLLFTDSSLVEFIVAIFLFKLVVLSNKKLEVK